jgi:hypothetical protein
MDGAELTGIIHTTITILPTGITVIIIFMIRSTIHIITDIIMAVTIHRITIIVEQIIFPESGVIQVVEIPGVHVIW